MGVGVAQVIAVARLISQREMVGLVGVEVHIPHALPEQECLGRVIAEERERDKQEAVVVVLDL